MTNDLPKLRRKRVIFRYTGEPRQFDGGLLKPGQFISYYAFDRLPIRDTIKQEIWV